MSVALAELLAGDGYLSYAYGYPHKTAYRPLDPPVSLAQAWSGERRDALFVYAHVPFCEQRCGFCNLYTQAQPAAEVEAAWLAALERQSALLRAALASPAGPPRAQRFAVGGGTPTWLEPAALDRVLRVVRTWAAPDAPGTVEASPGTLDDERAALLRAHAVSRVSLGVQSFSPGESAAVQRAQTVAAVEAAMARVAWATTRNVDLIYGIPGQDAGSLRASIDAAIGLGANELYLYPLYVRPLTGLGRRGVDPARSRLGLYRAGRDHLRTCGWTQATMRCFRAPGTPVESGTPWRCQVDGMVGLGVGARSYTRTLHYAAPYSVAQSAVRAGIAAWCARTDAAHLHADHGVRLGPDEERRRFVLLTLLEAGLDRAEYRAAFGGDPLDDLPQLAEAIDAGLVSASAAALTLTEAGTERADVLGYWLQSDAVRAARRAWVGA